MIFLLLCLTYFTPYDAPWIHPCGCVRAQSLQLCLTLCDSIDCISLPGSSVHGVSQATILEWVAISFSRVILHPGIDPESLVVTGQFSTTETTGKPYYELF